MAGRRILYLLTWVGCLVFFWAYRQWLAWYILVAVTCLPAFSLLISLPAMLSARLEISLPEAVTVGTPAEPELTCKSKLPLPLWRCKLSIENPLTGQRWKLKSGQALPTEHCGTLVIDPKKAWVCDYLGLFHLPLKGRVRQKLPVRQVSVAMEQMPELDQNAVQSWKPKRGGGFAENYELRLYQPGDAIQQIHWKLSGKTGKLILREPMEPVQQRLQLRLDLKGTPAELDRLLGQLLWLGQELLERNIPFEIHCLTGSGLQIHAVDAEKALEQAMDSLLSCTQTVSGSVRNLSVPTARYFDIGGGANG